MTGSLLGTPSYMSPEQARGSGLDGRSDLFAVGAILYEMLAGKKAFRGDSITGPHLQDHHRGAAAHPQSWTRRRRTRSSRIIGKALGQGAGERATRPDRELADDLLALTRPGSTPTLRQTEVAILPATSGPLRPTSRDRRPCSWHRLTQHARRAAHPRGPAAATRVSAGHGGARRAPRPRRRARRNGSGRPA